MRYLFIGTGRSGSSLLFKVLEATKQFNHNAQKNTEPEHVAGFIRLQYPTVNVKKVMKLLPEYDNKPVLAKVPEFTLISKYLLEKKLANLIMIERSLKDSVKSHISLGWHKWVGDIIGGGIKREMIERNLINRHELKNPIYMDIAWFAFQKLKMYQPKSDIIYMDFNEWMNNFVEYTGKLFDKLKLDYDHNTVRLWKKLKKTKQQQSARNRFNKEEYNWDNMTLRKKYQKRIKKMNLIIGKVEKLCL